MAQHGEQVEVEAVFGVGGALQAAAARLRPRPGCGESVVVSEYARHLLSLDAAALVTHPHRRLVLGDEAADRRQRGPAAGLTPQLFGIFGIFSRPGARCAAWRSGRSGCRPSTVPRRRRWTSSPSPARCGARANGGSTSLEIL